MITKYRRIIYIKNGFENPFLMSKKCSGSTHDIVCGKDAVMAAKYLDEAGKISPPTHCTEHASKHFYCVVSRDCEFAGENGNVCARTAKLAKRGYRIPTHCYRHAPADYESCILRECEIPDCDRTAYFGIMGKTEERHCVIHKKAGETRLSGGLCCEVGCGKNVSERRGIWCTIHTATDTGDTGGGDDTSKKYDKSDKSDKGVDVAVVIRKEKSAAKKDEVLDISVPSCKCIICFKQKDEMGNRKMINATWCNEAGIRLWCAKHGKENGGKKKIYYPCKLCGKPAKYGDPTTRERLYCDTHCDMEKHINLCKKVPGLTNRVRQERKSMMLRMAKDGGESATVPAVVCMVEGCSGKAAEWSVLGKTPTHCTTHKITGMIMHTADIDVNELMAIANDMEQSNRKEEKSKTRRLAKQQQVREMFDNCGLKYESYDKAANSLCGRERPDFVFGCETHKVIVEVDENQHKRIPNGCELLRMYRVTSYYGGMPVFWIRYNPDSYKHLKSSDAAMTANRSTEFRLLELVRCVRKALSAESAPRSNNADYGRVMYLFFDQWDGEAKIERFPTM